MIYVTDAGQANHFAGVFQVAGGPAGSPMSTPAACALRLVQGETARSSNPAGDTVRLRDLLDEAVERAN